MAQARREAVAHTVNDNNLEHKSETQWQQTEPKRTKGEPNRKRTVPKRTTTKNQTKTQT